MRRIGPSVCLAIVIAIVVAWAPRLFSESYQYSSHGKRDPFIPIVGVDRPAVVDLDDAVSIDDIRLEGIATGARGEPVAIVNGKVYREGAKAGEVELVKIGKKSITIMLGGKSHERFLAGEEGGNKGGE